MSLFKLAMECMPIAKGDIAKCERLMLERINADPSAYLGHAARYAAKQMPRKVVRDDRAQTMRRADVIRFSSPPDNPKLDPKYKAMRRAAASAGVAAALLDFKLTGNKKLRDAERPEVVAMSENYFKQGRTCIHRAKWLQSVAQGLTDNKTVGQTYTEQQLQDMYNAS